MIKYAKFRFEEIETSDHWVAFPNFSATYNSEVKISKDYRDVDISLNPEKVYQMSMDQSSTNTGIFIKDYANTEAYMIEVRREKGQDAPDYTYDLEMFLHDLCEGCVFSHIIYERPINTENFQSARALFQLEGAIRALGKRYKEFSSAKIDCIENSSWRSVVIDKTLEKEYGVQNRKLASLESVIKIWKWTDDYGNSLKADNDVYEAIGIMMGWFFNSFDGLGRPYVRGDKSSRTVGGFVLPGLDGETVKAMLSKHGIESEFYVENPRYSIYQNLTGGVQPYTLRCVEVTTRYTMLCLCVECNIKWMEPDVMTVILCDASTVDTKLKEITGGEFHFVL